MADDLRSVTRLGVEYQKAWRKIAGEVAQGYKFVTEETAWIASLKREPMALGRENLVPLDLNEEAGVATIDEGGMEAEPSSVALEEGFITVSQFNARFNLPLLVKYADRGNANQLERQLKLQGKKKVQAVGMHIGDYLHGSSTAVLATTDTDLSAASVVVTLTNGYGNTNITNAPFIVDKFKKGDRVAFIDGASLVANGTVTARDKASGTITVNFGTSPGITTNGLKVVKANQVAPSGGRTITQTDFNRGLVGMQDVLFGASLHSLTHENWAVAMSSSAAGRFTGGKIRKAEDAVDDEGVRSIDTIMIDKAVYRDLVDLERSALRFDDPMALSVDGKVKSSGKTWMKTRRVPPGYVIPFAKGAMRRWDVFEGSTSWGYEDGKEYIDQNAMVFRLDRVLGIVHKSRKDYTVFTNQTRAA